MSHFFRLVVLCSHLMLCGDGPSVAPLGINQLNLGYLVCFGIRLLFSWALSHILKDDIPFIWIRRHL